MSDPKQSAIMEILPATASASYFAKPNLFPLVVFKQVSLSVRYGNHMQSAFAYATYGLVMCGSTLEFDEGLKFGEIATRLLEKFKTDAVYAKIHYIRSNFITHWRYHFRDCLDEMTDSYYKGLETGDFLFAAYAAFNICTIDYYMGKPLPQLQKEMDEFAASLVKIKQNLGLGWLNIYRQTVANLLDEKEGQIRLEGPFFDEKIRVAEHEKGKDFSGLCVFYMNRMLLAYLFGRNREALENGEQSIKLIDNVLAGPHVSCILYFYTLTLLRVAGDDPSKRSVSLRRAEANMAKLKKFAKSNPAIFSSKLHLVEAEWHRIRGKNAAAAASYRNAIQAARDNEFIHEEAIAHELAAAFWRADDSDKSRWHLVEARKAYRKWGAPAKVAQLDRLFDLKPVSATPGGVTTIRSGGHSSAELDMLSLTKAALAIAGEIHLDKLMSKLMNVVVENAGAQRGYLVIERDGRWRIEAAGQADESENLDVILPTPLQGCSAVAESVIQYVIRTREDLVLGDVRRDSRFANDPVVQRKQLQSVLCLPVVNQGKIIGILYAENNLTAGVFTDQRVQFMKLLSGQVAVSLENALQYERLEQKVASRTAEVVQQKEVLEKSLHDLKMAQAKLVESEKMASLGQLTAGIAHEINNPINFVAVGVKNLVRNFEEAQQVMDTYLNPDAEPDAVAQQLSEKERRRQMLEIFEDSAGLFKSIQNGVERTISIVKSLRNFSRLDEGEIKTVDLHEGLDSTLEILQGQIRKKADIIKKYGDLPPVECAAGKINQIFLNIINNALQAIQGHGTITLETRFWPERREVEIAISDTGSGMNEATRRRLFEPFFTTKPVGEGTGLGLSISYNIIEEHKGRIDVESVEGQGSTFRIYLPVKDVA
jgi:signal transduction histidine kinase